MNKKYSKLVNRISESGITHAFGIPGGGDSLQLIDALNDVKIPFYRTHHEAAAAIMAGTIGHLSGNPALAISIKGPGLTNMLPGIALCHFENYPLLAVCESYDEKSPKLIGHKGIDQDGLVNTISKGSYYYNDDINRFESAFSLSKSGTSGPVLINLAKGDKHIFGNTALINEKPIQTISTLIEECRKPIIIAGSSVFRAGLSNELSKLNIPIFTTLAAKGLIDENLHNSAGIFTGSGGKIAPEYSLFPKSDLIIGLGINENELLNPGPLNCESINIVFSNDHTASCFGHNLICERKIVLDTIKSISNIKWGLDDIRISKENLHKYLLDNDLFLPAAVFDFISNHFDSNYRMILDTGYFCTIAEHLVKTKSHGLFLCAANSRYMGTGVPMGIGAALFDNSIPTVIAIGDGGIGMYLAELKLAIENKLPIIIILMSDGAFGSIKSRAIEKNLNYSSLIIPKRSWKKTIESYGIPSTIITNLQSLEKYLSKKTNKSLPLFIECHFNPSKYMEMITDLRY